MFFASPLLRNVVTAVFVLILAAWAMVYIREKATYSFSFFALIAIGSWYLQTNFRPAKFFVGLCLALLILLAYGYVAGQAADAVDSAADKRESYAGGSAVTSRSDSLGVTYVVNQPMPIRVMAGSIYLLIRPIPLWGYFKLGTGEYLIIMGYQGVFAVVLVPMILVGCIAVIKKPFNSSGGNSPHLFVMLYFLATVVLVAITTLEVRHYGQFVPGMILMGSMVQINSQLDLIRLTRARYCWFGLVVIIHIAWGVLRFF